MWNNFHFLVFVWVEPLVMSKSCQKQTWSWIYMSQIMNLIYPSQSRTFKFQSWSQIFTFFLFAKHLMFHDHGQMWHGALATDCPTWKATSHLPVLPRVGFRNFEFQHWKFQFEMWNKIFKYLSSNSRSFPVDNKVLEKTSTFCSIFVNLTKLLLFGWYNRSNMWL